MRAAALLPLTLLLCSFGAAARGESNTLCDYRLRYDIEVDGDRLLLTHAETAPDVRIAGDRVWIGGAPQTLSTIERQRLASYRAALIVFTRDAARLAAEGLQLGIDRAISAIAALSGDADGRQALRQRFDGVRSQLRTGLDGRHLPARAFGSDFDDALDVAIAPITAQALVEMSSTTSSTLAMSPPAAARPQARRASLDQPLEIHDQTLARQTEALCGQLRRLDALENAIGRFSAFDLNRGRGA
jgi:hypothetical protein